MAWEPQRPQPNPIKLSDFELKELRIIKQAILKSAIEGGQIIKKENEGNDGNWYSEPDEEFLERWISWVFREGEKDFHLVRDTLPKDEQGEEVPF